jgi:hypothetical protein
VVGVVVAAAAGVMLCSSVNRFLLLKSRRILDISQLNDMPMCVLMLTCM